MVTITSTSEKFIFQIKGWHQLWTLHDKIIVQKKDITNVYQDLKELNQWKGIRVGTYIPGVIVAGTFSWKGKRNFWDVMKNKNTIIVELQNNIYNKLYIEVANPEVAMQLLKGYDKN